MTQPVGWNPACIQCVAEYKIWMLKDDDSESPTVQGAVTLMNGTAICIDHLQVQPQSPLVAASPLLANGGLIKP